MSRLTQLAALIQSLEGRGFHHIAQIQNGLPTDQAERTRVMNSFTPGNPAIMGMGFTVNLYEQIVARAYDVRYPDIEYTRFMPSQGIDTGVNPGAKLASVRVRDWRGRGAFRAVVGKDIPTVGVSADKITVPLEAGGVMLSADIEDIRSVAFGFEGVNLLTDLGAAARKAYERHRELVFFFGYTALGFDSFLNTSTVTATTAGTKGAGGTTWAVATPAEIVKDFVTGVSTIFTNSRGIFKVNRITVPLAQYALLTMTNIGGTSGSLLNETVMSYLTRVLAQFNGGQPVEITYLRYLNDVGSGGTARMIFETIAEDTHYVADPVPFQMLAPQDVAYATNIFADYKFSGFLRPQPRAALFMDGI